MSLFKFGFSKQLTVTETSVTVKTEVDDGDTSSTTGEAFEGVIAVNERSDRSHWTTTVQERERDPSRPVSSEFLDSEIKLGPVPVEVTKDCNSGISGTTGRIFRREWINSRKWLEYSQGAQKSFCFPCRLFGRNMSAAQILGHVAFISKGFNDWKNAHRGFARHESSQLHRTCDEMLHNRMKQLQDSATNACIGGRLSAAFREVSSNRNKKLQTTAST